MNKTTASTPTDIICQYVTTVQEFGVKEIQLSQYGGSGITASLIIDFDLMNNVNVNAASYNTIGLDISKLKVNNFTDSFTSYQIPSKQYAWREGGELWISAKWDYTKDILIKFDNNEFNNRMVVRSVGLAYSVGIISEDIKRAYETEILNVTELADNIGPFLINGDWSGGGHAYPTNTSDPKYPTADILSYNFFADGQEIPENTLVSCDAVQVVATHELYDPPTTPSSLNTVILHEKLSFNVIGGNIETMCEFECISPTNIGAYYGMQTVTGSWQDTIYFAHSGVNNQIQNWVSGLVNGSTSTSPNLEKAIISNTDRSICLAMDMDIDKGILLDRDSNLNFASVVFTSGTKTYWRLIGSTFGSMSTGDREYWRGRYNYFKNMASGADYLYYQYESGVKYLIVDFVDSPNSTYKVFAPYTQNRDIEVVRADNTITIDSVVKPDGVEIVVTGYGNAKIKV